MYGVHSGPLKIYVTNDKAILGNAYWENTGDQGDQWFLGQVVISTSIISKGSFYVITRYYSNLHPALQLIVVVAGDH